MLYLGSILGNWQDLDEFSPPSFLPVAFFVLYFLFLLVIFDPLVSSIIYLPLQVGCFQFHFPLMKVCYFFPTRSSLRAGNNFDSVS